MNKTISLFITFLLLSLVASLFFVNPAKSQFSGSIYIRNDGSIDPSSAPIQQTGDVYTLLDDIIGNITIQRDNIVVDGAGFIIEQIESALESTVVTTGIDLTNRTGVTIKNLRIKNFVNGILIFNSLENSIIENVITECVDGVRLDSSSDNIILGNNITSNFHGIHPSFGNLFYNNNLVDNVEHVKILPTDSVNSWDNGLLSGGNFWGNYTGQDIDGDGIGDSSHVINSDNVDRYPIMELFVGQLSFQEDQTILYLSIGLIIITMAVVIGFLILKKR